MSVVVKHFVMLVKRRMVTILQSLCLFRVVVLVLGRSLFLFVLLSGRSFVLPCGCCVVHVDSPCGCVVYVVPIFWCLYVLLVVTLVTFLV